MSELGHEEGPVDLLPVTIVHAFPVNSFIENIAVRKTGQLMLTFYNTNALIQLDPTSAEWSTVHTFPTGISGIVEVEDDVFYVNCGELGVKGSFAVYKVEMGSTPAKISKHVEVPDALFLNGSALLSSGEGTILLADSLLGAVFCANVHSATVKLWFQDKALGKATDDPMMPGVNGIKLYNGYLYLSNTDAKEFLRVKVSETGEATGEVEVVAENLAADDFVFDSEGSAYLTTHFFQSVVKLSSDGSRSRIAGGPEDKIAAGPTAAAFGRTPNDRSVLYVTTTGGMSLPVGGQIEPGRVLKIDVGHTGDYNVAVEDVLDNGSFL